MWVYTVPFQVQRDGFRWRAFGLRPVEFQKMDTCGVPYITAACGRIGESVLLLFWVSLSVKSHDQFCYCFGFQVSLSVKSHEMDTSIKPCTASLSPSTASKARMCRCYATNPPILCSRFLTHDHLSCPTCDDER